MTSPRAWPVWLALIFSTALTAQAPDPAPRAIPAMRMVAQPASLTRFAADDTLLYARFAGIEAAASLGQKSELQALFHEAEVQAFLAPWLARWRELDQQVGQKAAERGTALREALSGPIEIALRGTTIAWSSRGEPTILPSFLVGYDLGAQADARLEAVLQALEPLVGKAKGDPIMHYGLDQNGIEIHRHEFAFEGLRLELHRTRIGRTLLLAPNPWALREALDRSQMVGARLEDAEALTKGRRLFAPATALVELWISAEAWQQALGPFAPDELRHVLRRLGLDRVQGLYLASGLENGVSRDLALIASPEPHRGLLAVDGGKPLSPALAALAPKGTLAFAAGRMDPAALFDLLQLTANEILPTRLARTVRGAIGIAGGAVGGELREDALLAFGAEAAVFMGPGADRLMPDFGLLIEVRDRAKVERLLRRVAKTVGAEWKERKIGTATLWFLDGLGDGLPIKPCLAFTANHLVIGPTRSTVEGVLAREGQASEGLSSNPTFAAALPTSRAGTARAMAFVDLPRAVGFAFSALRDVAPSIWPKGLDLDPLLLPSSAAVERHLRPMSWTVSPDAAGAVFSGHGTGFAAVLASAATAMKNLRSPIALIDGLARWGRPFPPRETLVAIAPVPVRPLPARNAAVASSKPDGETALAALELELAADARNAERHAAVGDLAARLGRFDRAASAWTAARELGAHPGKTSLELAIARARLGELDVAVAELRRALRAGAALDDRILKDEALRGLRARDDYRALLDQHRSALAPR